MADNPPSEKVFVGDIPIGADEEQIRHIFSVYGTITDCKVLPPRTPDTKGAALVRFETLDSAQWLVENVNGNIPQGMNEPVYITFAKRRDERGGGSFSGGYGKAPSSSILSSVSSPYSGGARPSSNGPPVSEKLFIGDVPVGMDDETFKRIMSKYGTVVDVKLLPARAPGEKGSALLRYQSVDEARWVVENMNGNVPDGMAEALYICFAKNTGRGGGNNLAAAVGPFTAARGVPRGLVEAERPQRTPAGKHAAAAALAIIRAALHTARSKGGGGSDRDHYRERDRDRDRDYDREPGGWGGGGHRGASGNDINAVVRSISRSGILPGSGKKPDANTIQVTNLPANTCDLDLYKLFAPFGAVAVNGVKAMLNEDGDCRGIGFVDYVDPSCAAMAIMTMNNCAMPDGTPLCVQMRPPSRPKFNGSS